MLLNRPVETILVKLMAVLSCDGYLLSARVVWATCMFFTIHGRSGSVIMRAISFSASYCTGRPSSGNTGEIWFKSSDQRTTKRQHTCIQIAPLSQLCSCLLMNCNCVSSLKESNLEVQQWIRSSQQFFTLRVCSTAIGTILPLAGLMGFLGQPG